MIDAALRLALGVAPPGSFPQSAAARACMLVDRGVFVMNARADADEVGRRLRVGHL